MSVRIGDEFRSAYADSNPLWKVTGRGGRNVVIATIQDEPIQINGRTYPSDYAGVEKAFLVSDVEQAKRMAAVFERLEERQEDFFDTLSEGDIVHYNDGFQNFVRCEIVMGTPENVGGLDPNENIGRLVMLPIALVGDWKSYDLPRRAKNGSVVYGYHAQKIVDGNGAWRANEGCIFESPGYSYGKRPNALDPTKLPALPLEPPSMTEDEAQLAAAEQLREQMIDLLSQADDPVTGIIEALKLAGVPLSEAL